MTTPARPRPHAAQVGAGESMRASTHSRRWLATGLAAIGVGLALVAVLGPLGTEAIDYRVTETLRNQTIGLDIVSLVLVAPLSLLAAVLVLRGHLAGFAFAPAIGAYTSYMLLQYVLGPDYASLPGNNERLFPLCLFLFASGWMVALHAWRAVPAGELPRAGRPNRAIALVLAVLGFVTFVRYVPALADWMSAVPEDEVYVAGPDFAWAIALLDLGIFLPATVAACVGLFRGASWALKLTYAVVGWFGLVGAAVAAMAIAMYVNDDPTASGGNTVFMVALGVAFALFALFLYRPLARRPGDASEAAATGLGK